MVAAICFGPHVPCGVLCGDACRSWKAYGHKMFTTARSLDVYLSSDVDLMFAKLVYGAVVVMRRVQLPSAGRCYVGKVLIAAMSQNKKRQYLRCSVNVYP